MKKVFRNLFVIAVALTLFAACETEEETPENNIPQIAINTPEDGASFVEGSEISFACTASDEEDADLSISWSSSLDGELSTSKEFTTNVLTIGEHRIVAFATDSENEMASDTITITIEQYINQAPEISITTPEDNAVFTEGDEISFVCTAIDFEDGELSGSSVVWTSNLDGELFIGLNFTNTNLTAGVHQIIAKATDSDGDTTSDTISVEIQEPQQQTDEELLLLLEWMTGSFSSEAHADTTTNQYIVDVRLHMVRIWDDRPGYWLYVEQAYAVAPNSPYRQRIYKVFRQDGQILDEMYKFENDDAYVGAYATPEVFDVLTEDDLTIKDGCEVFLDWNETSETFAGGTQGTDCSATIPGLPQIEYITSETEISETWMTSWDRGYSGSGAWLMGPDWPYIFDKIEDYSFED